MSRAPVETGLRHNDPLSTVTSPQWLQWFQQSFDRLMSSFNGRAGAVMPQAGDYTAAQVGADAAGTAAAGTAAHLDTYDHPGYDSHLAVTGETHHGLDHAATYAPIAKGVTNGDTHDHSGGDGGQIDHGGLAGLTDDDHAQYLLLAGRAGQRAAGPLVIGGVTDNTTVEADGTLVFNGTATNWNDINISLIPPATGAAAPAIIPINGDPILKCYAFTGVGVVADELSSSLEILHDYKEGTDITPHVHWAPTTADIADVKFQCRYIWLNRDGVFSGASTTTLTVTTPGVAWQERRSSFPAISGAGKQIGSRFVFTLFRDPADAADTYTQNTAVHDFGVHLERDTVGSREITTK